MNYYFSGIGTFKGELKEKLALLCPHRLMSCHGDYIGDAHSWARLAGPDTELMLDSGAFTAWKSNKEVKLDHLIATYADFIEKYEHKLKAIWLINLDRIPGSPGVTASEDELAAAIVESDSNFRGLTQHFGARVLPVFHQNESSARLLEVAAMAEYICISPRNDLPEGSRVKWSSEAHAWLGGSNKTHGLATTGDKMLTGVPWFSADSASWVFAGAMGSVTVFLNGRMFNVPISSTSPARSKMGIHYTTLPPLLQEQIAGRIQRCGFTVEDAEEGHGIRMAINMLETIEYTNALKVTHIDQRGLFDL